MSNLRDKKFIHEALREGAKALARGDFPVGAVLVINGRVAAKTNNALLSKRTWGDHAETRLLLDRSKTIRQARVKNPKVRIELYTTLEPCLMCLGCAMLHRVDRVIFSCPDPRGGVSHMTRARLPSFYRDNWPSVRGGILKKNAYKMFLRFMSVQHTKQWKENKKLFEAMAAKWRES